MFFFESVAVDAEGRLRDHPVPDDPDTVGTGTFIVFEVFATLENLDWPVVFAFYVH